MIISDCLFSYTRSQVVQSTFFYDKDFLGWVSPSPTPQAKYLSLIAPFQPLIWLLGALSILVLAVVFYIVANLESELKGIDLNEWAHFKESAWYAFGTFIGESITRDTRSDAAPAMRYPTDLLASILRFFWNFKFDLFLLGSNILYMFCT